MFLNWKQTSIDEIFLFPRQSVSQGQPKKEPSCDADPNESRGKRELHNSEHFLSVSGGIHSGGRWARRVGIKKQTRKSQAEPGVWMSLYGGPLGGCGFWRSSLSGWDRKATVALTAVLGMKNSKSFIFTSQYNLFIQGLHFRRSQSEMWILENPAW